RVGVRPDGGVRDGRYGPGDRDRGDLHPDERRVPRVLRPPRRRVQLAVARGRPGAGHRRVRSGLADGGGHQGVLLRHPAGPAAVLHGPRRGRVHGHRRDLHDRPVPDQPAAGHRRRAGAPGRAGGDHVSDLEVISFRPEFEQYAWTFGGAPPVKRIRTPAVLEVYTEDCFAGRVRSEQDLVSQVCEFPYLNPQTGPFHIEGAEPGDTVAVHFVSIEPARSWAASTTVPLFGALTSTHLTATLQEPLPEVVWLWQLGAGARTRRVRARGGLLCMDLPVGPV